MRPTSDFRAGRHYLPKVALSTIVNSLEGVSARRVRARRLPEVTSVLRGPAFGSASYCVVSGGGAPLEIVKTYIRGQAGSSGRAASYPPIAAATARGFRGGTTGDVTR
jgi:putative transposase